MRARKDQEATASVVPSMGESSELEVAPHKGFAGGDGRILPGKSPDTRGAGGHAAQGDSQGAEVAARRGNRGTLAQEAEWRIDGVLRTLAARAGEK